ncbi:MAG: helix-turn-helix transcriptional regulator [Christensenellales bacterium]
MDMRETGAFLKKLRMEKAMTQADMAERLGVTPQSVSNWERGESLPDAGLLIDIAMMLETSVDAILGGGREAWRFRRRVTVSQLREAMVCLRRIGDILGRDHFIYDTMRGALDTRMNSDVTAAFSEERIMDAYIGECAIACVRNGDYIDPGDLKANLTSNPRALEATLEVLRAHGIK